MAKDYHYILGVKPGASIDEIKRAYRKLSLKFHPDKNDGDEFFTERFKDIQEAYEYLNAQHTKEFYDQERSKRAYTSSNDSRQAVSPEVKYFKANKSYFEFGDEITFSWHTINTNRVTIRPFGEFPPIGQKTYRIKDLKNQKLVFELIAEDTQTKKQATARIVMENKSFDASNVRSEEGTDKESSGEKSMKEDRQNLHEEKYNSQLRMIGTIVLVLLAIFTLFRVVQQMMK